MAQRLVEMLEVEKVLKLDDLICLVMARCLEKYLVKTKVLLMG